MRITPRRHNYRRIFLAVHGDGPWTCFDCGEPVLALGRRRDLGVIHHVDHDHWNHDERNLVVSHLACHARHHQPKGTPAKHGYTPEIAAKIAKTKRGQVHIEPQVTCECGKVCHAGPMKRHTNKSGHALASPLDTRAKTR